MVKNILFDLGGILYHISYQKTIDAFTKLGIKNASQIYNQQSQSQLFSLFETGKIDESEFLNDLQKINPNIPQKDLKIAWNSMLIGMPKQYINLLNELKNNYRLFLLSNANSTHIDYVKKDLKISLGINSIESYFEKAYFSHEIGMRKPHPETFDWVLNDAKIKAKETLFIEDTLQHIEGAKSIGLKTLHLKTNEAISIASLGKVL